MTIIKKCKDCKHFMIDCSFLKVDKDFHVMEDFITCKHFKPKNETNAGNKNNCQNNQDQ